jgi:hypothetical protein
LSDGADQSHFASSVAGDPVFVTTGDAKQHNDIYCISYISRVVGVSSTGKQMTNASKYMAVLSTAYLLSVLISRRPTLQVSCRRHAEHDGNQAERPRCLAVSSTCGLELSRCTPRLPPCDASTTYDT